MLTQRALADHLAWQQRQLISGDPHKDRFLVVHPGDRFVACIGSTSKDACIPASKRRLPLLDEHTRDQVGSMHVTDRPYRGRCNWDALVMASLPCNLAHIGLANWRPDGYRALVAQCGRSKLTWSQRIALNNSYFIRPDIAPCNATLAARSSARDMLDMLEPMRTPPGLGNIVEAVISAAALAILTRRILVIEGWPTAPASFGPPLAPGLLVGRTDLEDGQHAHAINRSIVGPWHARLVKAQPFGSPRFDTFASHDGLSAASLICHSSLDREPAARVWRVYSNENFLPIIRANKRVEQSGGFIARDGPAVWSTLARALMVPTPDVEARVAAYYAKHIARRPAVGTAGRAAATGSVEQDRPPTLGFHFRCVNLNGACTARNMAMASHCALLRLRALENATLPLATDGARRPRRAQLFLATIHSKARRHIEAHLRLHGHKVIWHGDAQERQEASESQEASRLIDAMLIAKCDGILLSRASTFGYVIRALAGESQGSASGQAAPTYHFDPTGATCAPVSRDTEPPLRNKKLLDKCGLPPPEGFSPTLRSSSAAPATTAENEVQ